MEYLFFFMSDDRFTIIKKDNEYFLNDGEGVLILNATFKEMDNQWLSELTDFLNKTDIVLRDIFAQYNINLIELNQFRSKIISHLQEELEDCEVLSDVDDTDLYTQGRLIEIHNIMKVLL